MSDETMNVLKLLANKRMELSIARLEKEDHHYHDLMKNVAELSNQYEDLDLPLSAKALIEKLFTAKDMAEIEETSLAYLAGMKDCLLILKDLKVIEL